MKKMFFIFIIIFSLIIVNSLEYICYSKEDSFNKIEKIMLDNYGFVENGVKVEYSVESSIEEEKNRIKNILTDELNLEVNEYINSITALNDVVSYNITLYQEDVTRVEIIIINKDIDLQITDLRQLADKVKSNNCIDERFFSFIKGKIKTNDDMNGKEIYDEVKEDTIESINISNGEVIKATLNDGKNINIGQINYNTGSYLIIGTPVIFVTY